VQGRMICTHKQSHGECIQYENKEELEEMGSVSSKTRHPICAKGFLAEETVEGCDGAHIDDTMIVGIRRNGTTSKMNRDNNHAVGLTPHMIMTMT
jgi:hypothetical protein